MEEEQEQAKMPFTPDDTYSQYAQGMPPPEPEGRPLDAEDEAAIEAVVGEQPAAGPDPEEAERLLQERLQGAEQGESSGGPPPTTGERLPSEREGGVMTTSSEEMVDVMQETQGGSTTTLGELTSERDTGAGDRGLTDQPPEAQPRSTH